MRKDWPVKGHENTQTVPSSGARIFRIRLAAHPLCPDLCLGLLPTTFYEESIRQKRLPHPHFHPAFRLLWVLLSSVWTGWECLIHRSGNVGQQSLPSYLGFASSLQPGESEIVGAVEDWRRQFESHRCSRKLRYFNLFEFFDHKTVTPEQRTAQHTLPACR